MSIEVKSGEYVDVNDALKRVGGNMGLYKKLLGRFVEGNHMAALVDALKSDDKEEPIRMAHTIKGVSANLSLIKIRDITTELEQVLKDGADHSAHLAELQQAYDVTVAQIAEITG